MKKFKKIIFSICFVVAFILSINIKLFAQNGYTIDNEQNIISQNKFTNKNWINNRAINISADINTYESEIRFYYIHNNDPYAYMNYKGLEQNQEYTITIYTDVNLQSWSFNAVSLNNNTRTYTFTNTSNSFELGFEFLENQYTECNIKIMINNGNESLEFFPYGTYYNSSNTLNNNSYLSPFNIDYVESETFYINGQLEQGEEPVGYGGTYLFYDIQHTNAPNQNNWKSIINFNRILPSMTILFKPSGNNIYSISVYKNEELIQYIPIRYNENLEESDYYFTLPEFNKIELYCDIVNLSAPNQEIVLANTYEQGYTYGYSNGYNEGYAQGESSSYGNGYSTGYQKGIREANQNSLYNMILAIVDTPIHIFKGIFDFNVLGINLTNFVLSLISILIVVWLLKFFL